MAGDALRPSEGGRMIITFKISGGLLAQIRADLVRPHTFAHERVGFISAGVSSVGKNIAVFARNYRPVADENYLDDKSVGAMMSREAIREALEWSMRAGHAMFHVHTHGGDGLPSFSGVDLRENRKFIPDFFKVMSRYPHGALVLSDTVASGQIWLGRTKEPVAIDEFVVVGSSLQKWSHE